MVAGGSEFERAVASTIQRIPSGKVATYGEVAEAAGYPGYHRHVARLLSRYGHALPWHRVVGAGGEIKTRMEAAADQRLRLQMEGVKFRGRKVDLTVCGWLAK